MKVLALIKEDEQFRRICNLIHDRENNIKERIHFFRKQAEEAVKEDREAITGYWKQLTARLIETGRLPEGYKQDKHSLSFSIEEDAIKLDDQQENPLRQLIASLTGKYE